MSETDNTMDPRWRDRLLIQAYLDGELDAAGTLAFAERLKAEPQLAADCDSFAAVKSALGRLPQPVPGSDFQARIAALSAPAAAFPGLPKSFSRRQLAASLLLTAIASSAATWAWRGGNAGGGGVIDSIVNSHRRSLLAASPIDIASSDRHTVKPWFDAKLGLSPPVVDLSAQGFTLLGGRVEIIGGQALPVLVYRYREHLISVLVMPGQSPDRPPRQRSSAGLQLLEWSQTGATFWAVSDAEEHVLDVLAAGFRKAAAPDPPE